jgi:hypothetical protein
MRRALRTTAKRATAALLGVLLALGAAEAAVRLLPFELPPGIRGGASLHELRTHSRHHARLGFAFVPDAAPVELSTTDFALFRASIHAPSPREADVGFRDDFEDDPTWAVLLGDSFAMGWGVDDADTFAALTERALGRRILNFGICGWGPQQALAALEGFALDYHPQVVIWAYYANDLRDAFLFARWDPSRRMLSEKSAPHLLLNRHCALYKLYRYLAAPRSTSAYVWSSGDVGYVFTHHWQEALDPRREDVTGGLELTLRELDRLRDLAAAHGFRAVVVGLPYREQVYFEEYATCGRELLPAADVDAVYARVLEAARARGMPALDLLPELRQHKDTQLFFRHDCHLTVAGNRLVAQRLEAFLRAEVLAR